MRIMVSQPMKDKSKEEILTLRTEIHNAVKALFPDDNVELLNTFFDDFKPEAAAGSVPYRLQFLAKSITDGLAKCNVVIFAENWQNFAGCLSENTIAHAYGIPTWYYKEGKIKSDLYLGSSGPF